MAAARTRRVATPPRVSLRSLAKTLGVSPPAVRKAIAAGRLARSIGRDGKGPYVLDVALARTEWAAGAAKPPNPGGHPPGNGRAEPQNKLVDAQLRLASQRAESLELANRRRRGEVHDVVECEREQFQAARTLRDRILNVPDRMGLEPSLRDRLLAELRVALGQVADELERG